MALWGVTLVVAALCAAFRTGAPATANYTSAALGFGPDNNPEPYYVAGRTCGKTRTEKAWDKQLGAFNDSSLNPDLKPVTEVRTRKSSNIQTVWGTTVGPEHGFNDSTRQDILILQPSEVISKVELVVDPFGIIYNLTFYTNESRVWKPDNWKVSNDSSYQLFSAMPPTPAQWTGDPIIGDWYLAYVRADITGFCMTEAAQREANFTDWRGAAYFFTPILYFVWAAETISPTPTPLPAPQPSPVPPPVASPSPILAPATSPVPPPAKTKSKGATTAIIGGVIGGVVFLVLLAAIAWVFVRHGRATLAGGATAAGIGGGGGGVKDVAAMAGGGAAAGGAAAAAAAASPEAGAGRELPPSPPFSHPAAHATHAAAYYTPQPPTHTYYTPPAAHPPSGPALSPREGSTLQPPYPSFASSHPSTQPSLPPSASEQPWLGSASTAVALSSPSSSSGAPAASSVLRPAQRPAVVVPPAGAPAAMMAPGGGAAAVGPMAAVGAASAAVIGTVLLAKEILDAGGRVVANHARCLRLTTRIHAILPLLDRLGSHLEREGQAQGQSDLQHILNNVNGVFRDVRDCINRWCDSESSARRGVLVQVLRNLMVSKKFEDEFLDLNERLSGCYQDLILALNIKRAVGDQDPARVKQQHEEDLAADLKGVAEELSTEEGEQAWNSLPPEERASVREAFFKYGLNFSTLMAQVKKNTVGARVKDLIIPWRDIIIMGEIGSGGYGVVYRATWQDIDVAVKKLLLVVTTERAKRELSHEAYVMSLLRHPNVATSYGLVLERQHCALVMKYYARGTLLELLHDDSEPVTLRRKLQLATDVAKGMAYLHSRPSEPVIHGDLKPSNLLINDDGKVVITDFGLSRISTLTLTTRPSSSGMSVTYTAPEILADPTGRRTTAADVYAFGLVLFEIFTRGLPFESASDVTLVVQYVLGGGRPRVTGADFEELQVPPEVVELMQQCWQQVPQARPTFPAIVDCLKAINAE